MSVIRPRKKYFIKPGFQSRLTCILILIVIIVANFVGALVYYFSLEKLETNLVDELKLPIDGVQLGQALLPGVIIAELISIFLVAIICIKITHAIAGPVYRMERVARGIGEGDLTNFIKLRHKDELKDLADSMNEMTMGLRNKVINLKETSKSIREKVIHNDQKEALAELDALDKGLEAFIMEKEQRVRTEEFAEHEEMGPEDVGNEEGPDAVEVGQTLAEASENDKTEEKA